MGRPGGYNLASVVFENVRESIVSGEYQNGMALTEAFIAGKLNVSRTPVREALRRLEAEQLVKLIPNKGAVVQGVSADDARDIYEMRSLVEGLAAARAAQNATAEQIKNMEEILDLAQFYIQRNDYDKLKVTDGNFHQLLYDMTGSKTLKLYLGEMHGSAEKFRLMSIKTEGRVKESDKEHRSVMEAIKAHDAEKAKELMTLHVNNSYRNLVEHGGL